MKNELLEHIINNETAPWYRTWINDPNCWFPCNVQTKRDYRGIAPLLLNVAAQEKGFQSKWWGTLFQWKRQVKQGETGTKIPNSLVYNLEQVEGFDHLRHSPQASAIRHYANRDRADCVISGVNATIRESSQAAYIFPYPPNSFPNHAEGDYLLVPGSLQFADLWDYYNTVFHEIVHWTSPRLGRKISPYYTITTKGLREKHPVTKDGLQEELVATIGAAYLAMKCGIPHPEKKTCDNELKALIQESPKHFAMVVANAATEASRACDYIIQRSES